MPFVLHRNQCVFATLCIQGVAKRSKVCVPRVPERKKACISQTRGLH